MASCMTARGRAGLVRVAFSSIRCVSSSWSSEPQLTPMRTGLSYSSAFSTIEENWRSFLALKPTLPGLMRYFAKRLGARRIVGEQRVADVVEIADDRHVNAAGEELFA